MLVAGFCFLGCGGSNETATEVQTNNEAYPSRVVSLIPSLTEIVYAIGAQDRLVGVTPYCKYPPEAQEKAVVGALVNLDYEKLLSLSPDLVLLQTGHAELAEDLKKLGVPTMVMRTDTTEEIYAAILELGEALGERERSQEVERVLRAEMDAIRQSARERWSELGLASGPRVLFVIGRNPATLQQIYVGGSGSFLNELLAAIGVENAMGETVGPWPVVSKETIIKLDPDVILDASIRQGDAPVPGDEHMQAWNQLAALRAVREGRVVAVTNERITVPGPGIAASARELADLIVEAMKHSDAEAALP